MTYTHQIRGANQIPLVYIHMEHTDADTVIQASPFRDTDHEYEQTFALQGTLFNADSKNYYEILKHLHVDSLACKVTMGFDNEGNGRGAIRVCIVQAKGDSTRKSQNSAAYHGILVMGYRGPQRNFTLDDYIVKHADTDTHT